MALSAELEKLLGFVPEAEREATRRQLTELHEGGLRQAEFSRKLNEVDAKHKKNIEWYQQASSQYDAAQNELREARERLAALESASGHTDSFTDEDDLQKQLKAARAEQAEALKKVSALSETVTQFNSMLKEGKLITADKFDEEVNKRGDALGAAVLDIIDLETEHRNEFGTKLDRKALLAEAQRRGGNLSEAYKVITEESRQAKLRKDIEADVERKWQEKLKNSNVPYAADGEPVLGPLQQRLQKKETGIPEDVQADGSGRLASLVAQELRQEGKA